MERGGRKSKFKRKNAVHQCMYVTPRRLERERRRKKTNGRRADPVAVGGYPLLPSSPLSFYRHGDHQKNSEHVKLYPSKNGQNLYFLFLHPQTQCPSVSFCLRFVYPQSIRHCNSSPQPPFLSLPSTCLMNVPFEGFAPVSAMCCLFNPSFCLLLVQIPFGSSQM